MSSPYAVPLVGFSLYSKLHWPHGLQLQGHKGEQGSKHEEWYLKQFLLRNVMRILKGGRWTGWYHRGCQSWNWEGGARNCRPSVCVYLVTVPVCPAFYTHTSIYFQNLFTAGFIIPVLELRKPRLWDVKWLIQRQTGSTCWIQDGNPILISNSLVFQRHPSPRETVLKVEEKLLRQESNLGLTFHPAHRLEPLVNFL